MRVMALARTAPASTRPLRSEDRPIPQPGPGEVRVRVLCCGVCRTDLHVVEGDLANVRPGIVPGHEVVGVVDAVGPAVRTPEVGARVGVPWLHWTCGTCGYCRSGRENLCARKQFTGYSVDGGYAGFVLARSDFVLPLPPGAPAEQAPLLCAGIVGYRALKMALPPAPGRIGLFGFGGSAHLALQVAVGLGHSVVAYTRNPAHADLARRLGAAEVVETGSDNSSAARASLDGAVVFAPAGEVVLQALRELSKGATLAISAIHMTPLPALEYDTLLFGERRVIGVEANTREDAHEFLRLAERFRVRSTVSVRPLVEANEALIDLKGGRVAGAMVLQIAMP